MNENMNTETMASPARQAAMNGLAVVGFVALVTAGLWLAIYSTRFVPAVVNRIGSAAVYLGSVFTPAPGSTISVVPTPTASTTISFGNETATSTPTDTTTKTDTTPATPVTTPKPVTKPVATNTDTDTTSHSYPVGGTQTAPYGSADLAVSVIATGYLTQASTDAFVASSSAPYGGRAAIRFTVKNTGTNWSGTWTFNVSIPTSPAYTFHSPVQQSLAPGDSVDYTLGFDRARSGDQPITITIDPIGSDSNANNNSTTANVTVLGS